MDNDYCPLCRLSCENEIFFWAKFNFSYNQCLNCHLIYRDRCGLLPIDLEKDQYDLHENDPLDSGYREFLKRLTVPLVSHLMKLPKKLPGQIGLDYGCGPGPAINKLLQCYDLKVDLYDPLYFPNTLLEKNYDFITCTEVFEHFYNPHNEISKILGHLAPGGVLGVMTSLYNEEIDFSTWHYKNDPTHVAFYTRDTMQWVADFFQLKILELNNRIVIFADEGNGNSLI